MPVAWERLERELAGREVGVRDEVPKMMENIRELFRPLLTAETFRGKETRWRSTMLVWIRMKTLQKLAEPAFLDTVYGTSIAEAVRNQGGKEQEALRAVADGVAIAITDAVLEEVLKVK